MEKLKSLNLEVISPLAKKHRSGITIVKIKNAKEIVPKLFKKNIVVSARGKGLRISMHIYNNKKDIDRFVEELQKLIK